MNKRVSLLLCSCLLVGGLVAAGCKKAEPTKPKETPAPQNTGAADANEAPDAVPDAVPDANKAADALKGAVDPNLIAPAADKALKGGKIDVPKVDVPKVDVPKVD